MFGVASDKLLKWIDFKILREAGILSFPNTRESVYTAIETERLYQARRWGVRQLGGTFTEVSHSVGDYLVFTNYYMGKAEEALATKAGIAPALEELRKAAALLVACFEEHGITHRGTGGVVNGRDGEPA